MYYGIAVKDEDTSQLIRKAHILLLPNCDFPREIVAKSIVRHCLPDCETHAKHGKYNTLDLSQSQPPTDIPQFVNQIASLGQKIPHLSVLLPGSCLRWWRFWDKYLRTLVDVAIVIDDVCLDQWSVEPIQFVLFSGELHQHLLEKFDTFVIVQHDQLRALKDYAKTVDIHRNMLIDPLQPLTVALSPEIYSQFEKDEVKYLQYRLAMELALNDLQQKHVNILIIGPGMGKLIDMLLSVDHDKTISIVAIEKNPLCMHQLQEKNRLHWNNQIQLIHGDIRSTKVPFEPKIIISELLGSFGDNELCPEILCQFNGSAIMIPSSYTSFLQPIYTLIKPPCVNRPYLVQLSRYYAVDEYQPVWEFEHPLLDATSRSTSLRFRGQNGLKINGFYGHFTANLYGHINIHIDARGNTEEYCKSWYPILFPVEEHELTDEDIEFKILRKLDLTKVWYEWEFRGKTYNEKGESYSMGL